MTNSSPITKQEALQYDPEALSTDTTRRENNIKIFEDMILKENQAISNDEYILTQIDPTHKDVAIINNNIKKIKLNIKTFSEAILEERRQIERDLEMIKIIKKGSKN